MRISIGLMLAAVVTFIPAAVLAANGEPLAQLASLLLVSFGLLLFLFGFTGFEVGIQILKPIYGPTAVILPQQPGDSETWIELRNVHPTFVAALQQHQAARGAAVR